jgi:hypothetical protein
LIIDPASWHDLCNRGYQGKKPTPGQPYSQTTLKKREDMKFKLEEAILGTGNARTEMMLRRRQNSNTGLSGKNNRAEYFLEKHFNW